MAVDQSLMSRLTLRYRGQAPSHISICVYSPMAAL